MLTESILDESFISLDVILLGILFSYLASDAFLKSGHEGGLVEFTFLGW